MNWKKFPGTVLCFLLAIHILAHADRNMLLGFSTQITHDIAIGNTQYGFLVGAVWVLSFGIMVMFMGAMADRYSRPRVIAAGMLIWSVCTWASGYAQNFEQMVAARFLVASGEAALVPAAVALLSDLFPSSRRGTVIGIFFMGIPIGMGVSFLLAGTFGAAFGWRDTFHTLGYTGSVLALPLLLLTEKRSPPVKDGNAVVCAAPPGKPFAAQVRALWAVLKGSPALLMVIAGFALLHMVFAGLAFTPIWLVTERGLDAAGMATRIGALQLVFGTLGAAVGGGLGDWFARRVKGGHAGFIVLLIGICAGPMLAYRFVPAGTPLFYLGMCAGAFLPLAVYGPATALVQSAVPDNMRSTVAGFTMMVINVFAISLGSLAVGVGRDYLAAAGVVAPFTKVLFITDVLAISSTLLFAMAARRTQVLSFPILVTTQ